MQGTQINDVVLFWSLSSSSARTWTPRKDPQIKNASSELGNQQYIQHVKKYLTLFDEFTIIPELCLVHAVNAFIHFCWDGRVIFLVN
jgi:hypothetical protein